MSEDKKLTVLVAAAKKSSRRLLAQYLVNNKEYETLPDGTETCKNLCIRMATALKHVYRVVKDYASVVVVDTEVCDDSGKPVPGYELCADLKEKYPDTRVIALWNGPKQSGEGQPPTYWEKCRGVADLLLPRDFESLSEKSLEVALSKLSYFFR